MNSSYSEGNARTYTYPPAAMPLSQTDSLPWQEVIEETCDSVEEQLAKARIEGRIQGEAAAKSELDQQIQQLRCALGNAIHDFADQRSQHLRALEGEAVKLSMAIARRVLRRESQIDPALLLGLVRSALAELEHTSTIQLRVHPNLVDEWERHFRLAHPREQKPEIIADPTMQDHQCRIETSIGTTVLSLESSLAEIESGLFDLLSSVVRSGPALSHGLQ